MCQKTSTGGDIPLPSDSRGHKDSRDRSKSNQIEFLSLTRLFISILTTLRLLETRLLRQEGGRWLTKRKQLFCRHYNRHVSGQSSALGPDPCFLKGLSKPQQYTRLAQKPQNEFIMICLLLGLNYQYIYTQSKKGQKS
jgi:hypothetical protein